MMRRYILLLGLCLPQLSAASAGDSHISAKDIYFGEALYYAYQGKYIDAIPRLDIGFGRFYGQGKPGPDVLDFQFGNSRFSAGEFELSYRMHQRAVSAINAIYEKSTDQLVRNEAAYRLARIYLQNGDPDGALKAIGKIKGKIPEGIREDELFLRAQIYMANGRFADSVKLLQELQNATGYKGFAAFNLGVAYIRSGQENYGLDQFSKAGEVSGDDDVTSSIRDKANLTLGYRMIDAQRPIDAKKYLERVRLNGPFSNRALLASGWASVAMNNYESALTTWSVLSRRKATDESVQESMLGIPYVYSRLNLPGKAALLYSKSLEGYEQQLTRLDASIKSVREGKFLQVILREELKQDENWIAKLKSLPDTPETYYLLELMASNDFRGSLSNYLELNDLFVKLESWDENLRSYEELVSLRRQYYDPLLPGIDKQFFALDAKLKSLLLRRKNLDRALMGSPEKLQHKDQNNLSDAGNSAVEANKLHRQLDEDVQNLVKTQASIASLRQFVIQDYQGYDDQIRQLKIRVHDARQKVSALITRQGQMLEATTINELDQRRKRLRDYQARAMFALAESYERASKTQAK